MLNAAFLVPALVIALTSTTRARTRPARNPMTPAKRVLRVEVLRWPTRQFGVTKDRTGAWAVNLGLTSLWIDSSE